MFEFEAKLLKQGDEFTIDDGATWHRVEEVEQRSQIRVTDSEGTIIELLPYEKVIVK